MGFLRLGVFCLVLARHKFGGPARHPGGVWQAGLGQGIMEYWNVEDPVFSEVDCVTVFHIY